MTLTNAETEQIKKTIERILGLSRLDVKVYDNNPYTIKITDTVTNYYFIVQYWEKYHLLIRPEEKEGKYILHDFEDVLKALINWQVSIA